MQDGESLRRRRASEAASCANHRSKSHRARRGVLHSSLLPSKACVAKKHAMQNNPASGNPLATTLCPMLRRHGRRSADALPSPLPNRHPQIPPRALLIAQRSRRPRPVLHKLRAVHRHKPKCQLRGLPGILPASAGDASASFGDKCVPSTRPRVWPCPPARKCVPGLEAQRLHQLSSLSLPAGRHGIAGVAD